jgi:UDP-GlcNAc3NAcA epimerase
MIVMTAIGARPQFIKASPVSRALRRVGIEEVLVHSGQHYDDGLSQVFFRELDLPEPKINLEVGSGPHGKQTGQMLDRFEQVMLEHRPDWVIVHGDTNTTLSAALAAVKLRIRVAHNEAGLRSFNREMPEEHNRVLTDHCADLLFCPTRTAVEQLHKEGIVQDVYHVGDVMYDAVRLFAERAEQSSKALQHLEVTPDAYLLATLHRPYNVDAPDRLRAIFRGFAACEVPIVLPCHPRLAARLKQYAITPPPPVRLVDPVGYLDMVVLERHARMILTDSGGVQKEAYFHGVPCLTLRPETEWIETVAARWNRVVDADSERIAEALHSWVRPNERPELFGDGHAADSLVKILERYG